MRIFYLIATLLSFLLISCCCNQCSSDKDVFCKDWKANREALIVKKGSTIQLPAGGEYIFESILIHKGGTLEIIGEEPQWTILKTKEDFRLEGTIKSTGFKPQNNTTKISSIDGIPIYHTYGKDTKGGKGGAGGRLDKCKRGSCLNLKCFEGKDGEVAKGGQGGFGMSKEDVKNCQKGSKCNQCCNCSKCTDPTSGTSNTCNSTNLAPGKGGGGGSIGKSGGLIYISTCGSFLGENGTIDVSGGTGGAGKDGEKDKYTGGGGGGGGPGGNAGAVYFNVFGKLSLPDINTNGGDGGKGGKGGVPDATNGLTEYKGSDGKSGKKGNGGKLVLCQGDDCLQAKPN